MASFALGSTTGFSAAVARHAATLKDALRQAFSRAKRRQSPYVRGLKKAVLSSSRCKTVEQACALVIDLAQRGTLDDAEAIGLHLVAIARSEWAAAHPSDGQAQLSVQEAQMLEEVAEGAVEQAEMAMAQNPGSVSHALSYLSAAASHNRARRELDASVRRQVVSR